MEADPNSAADLNYNCNHNAFIAKTNMHLLSPVDRNRAAKWLRKLAACNSSIEEMKLRNDFMYYLVLNIQSHELRPPFNESPPQGPLAPLASLLPGGAEAMASLERNVMGNIKTPRRSGDFMIGSPLPRCGAFCYMSVVHQTIPKSQNK